MSSWTAQMEAQLITPAVRLVSLIISPSDTPTLSSLLPHWARQNGLCKYYLPNSMHCPPYGCRTIVNSIDTLIGWPQRSMPIKTPMRHIGCAGRARPCAHNYRSRAIEAVIRSCKTHIYNSAVHSQTDHLLFRHLKWINRLHNNGATIKCWLESNLPYLPRLKAPFCLQKVFSV